MESSSSTTRIRSSNLRLVESIGPRSAGRLSTIVNSRTGFVWVFSWMGRIGGFLGQDPRLSAEPSSQRCAQNGQYDGLDLSVLGCGSDERRPQISKLPFAGQVADHHHAKNAAPAHSRFRDPAASIAG